LQAVLEFLCNADFSQPYLAFVVASFLFNLSRADGDFEYTEGFTESLLAGLRKDSLLGVVYADVLMEADPGSPDLATSLADIICSPPFEDGTNMAGFLLVRCMESDCPDARYLAVLTMRLLCMTPEHRSSLANCGGIGALLYALSLPGEAGDALHVVGTRQALAQLCISAHPSLIAMEEQLHCIGHFVNLMLYPKPQLQLDGAMGLTNLLTSGDEARTAALQAGAWQICQELLTSEVEVVRRAAAEAMCNFTAAPEVVDYIASGQGELEIQFFTSFCTDVDHGTQVAATGALAMLARNPEAAVRIASGNRCQRLLEVFENAEDADIQHRIASCLYSLFNAPGLPIEVQASIKGAFREKRSRNGFVSSEAQALSWSLDEDLHQ
jgi:hypothetical protein